MPRRYYLLLTLTVLAGAFLRLWQLTLVPPGLHYDLAATALLGEAVAFQGFRPVFITAYTGHEALYYYWLALWFKLAGSSVFTLRLAAATLGVLAIPAGFFTLREALRGDDQGGLPAAALGAVFLATAFFHVVFSRFGFRVISEPVVQALALGFLLRGAWRLGDDRRLTTDDGRQKTLGRRQTFASFILAGFFTGLAAYTYLAARLFPVPLAVFWAALLWGAWRRGVSGVGCQVSRDTLYAFGAFAAAAVLAFAPLGLYFVQHPDDFLNRAAQVAPRAGEGALLLEGARRALEMVFLSGEPYDRFNIPGMPLLGPVVGVCFVVGLGVTVVRVGRLWRRGMGDDRRPTADDGTRNTQPAARPPVQLAIELLLLAWLPAMLLPTALAVHDIFPSNVRAFGLLPLLFVFPARGLLALYRGAQRFWPGPLIPHPYPLAVVTVVTLAATFYATGRNYFDVWARLPNQPQNNDADLTRIAAYLNERDLSATSVYVAAIHYRHPTLAYLAADFDSLHWLTGGDALAAPAAGAALYAFARAAPPPEAWLAEWGPYLVAAPLDPDGVPAFRAYYFPAGTAPPLPALAPLDENFANVIRLTGYAVQAAGAAAVVDLRWQVENLPEAGDYLPYARLTDSAGAVWAQSGGFSYPSEQWQPGDTVLTRLRMPLPAGLPPGDYTVRVGVYSAGAQAGLPRLGPDGAFAGERAALPVVAMPGRLDAGVEALMAEYAILPPAANTGLDVAPALLGYSLNTTSPRQGERLLLTLYWHAAQAPAASELKITLGGSELYAGRAARGTLPLSALTPGQVLADRYEVFVPAGQPAAATELSVLVPGLGAAALTTLDVQAVARSFEPLPFAVRALADLGPPGRPPLFALRGYTLEAGPPLKLGLVYWVHLPIRQDYTTFVHVLDAGGALVAQRDTAPRNGQYPTHLWQPGEYVLDEHVFDLPPGTYTLRLGFYDPETGERLRVAQTGADAVEIGPVTLE